MEKTAVVLFLEGQTITPEEFFRKQKGGFENYFGVFLGNRPMDI